MGIEMNYENAMKASLIPTWMVHDANRRRFQSLPIGHTLATPHATVPHATVPHATVSGKARALCSRAVCHVARRCCGAKA
jgi:hypothetical protein